MKCDIANPTKTAGQFRLMLYDDKTYYAPGVAECIGALAAQKAGFQMISITGNGVSASMLGMPDMGLMTMTEVTDNIRRITESVRIPVIADADTGYGEILNIMRTVRSMENAGAAAIHIEDQRFPKRCAYYEGAQTLADTEEHVMRIRAAVAARTNPDFSIIARTDAFLHYDMDEVFRRVDRYISAGADAVFVVGFTDLEQIFHVSEKIEAPLIINVNDKGPLNRFSKEEMQQAGVKIVFYPSTQRSIMVRMLCRAMDCLNQNGNTLAMLDNIADLDELNSLVCVQSYQEYEDEYSSHN